MAFQPQSETVIDHATEALIRADPNHQQLTARGAVILDRIQYKDELIDQLIAGRLTLSEVAGEFLHINEGTPVMNIIRWQYPGDTDEVKSAYNVLEFTRARKLRGAKNTQVFARLIREFEQAYGPTIYRVNETSYHLPQQARAQ